MQLLLSAALAVAWMLVGLTNAAPPTEWQGTWVTDEGLMRLETTNGKIQGKYGKQGILRAGSADNDTLTMDYRNGQSTGQVKFKLATDGQSFTGTWRSRGRSGTWRGWRQDPGAEQSAPADFSGHWLTSWGPLQIEQTGQQITGTYGADGRASITGKVTGRRMLVDWKRLRWKGTAWLEQTADGSRLFGMNPDNDASSWLGVRVSDYKHHITPLPGEIVKGRADNGMLYHLRMPNDWQSGEPVDVIVLLHGSNWTTAGMVHVTAKNWPEIGKRFAIVGIQGEKWVKQSDAGNPRFNYSYLNWMGRSTYRGYPYTDRESPYLVMEVIQELGALHNFDRVFVGGHSQGGYLSYILHMHFADQISGTFPMAGGLVMQAEPNVFEDAALLEQQRSTPLAIVHGRRDNVVSFKTGAYIYDRFCAHDFPLAVLISPDVGHPFDFLPVDEAVQYLDMMSTNQIAPLAEFAQQMVAARNWRIVGNAINRAATIGGSSAFASIRDAFETAAQAKAHRLKQAIESNENGDWIDEYLVWQERFSQSEIGSTTVAAYRQLQVIHDPRANETIREARKAFKAGDRQDGWDKYQQVVDEHYAAKQYKIIKKRLANKR